MLRISRRKFCTGTAAGVMTLCAPGLLRAAPRRWDVAIRGFAFDPPDLEIAVGDVVVWRNEDVVPHTATAVDGSWDTGQLSNGEEAEIVFEASGSSEYQCLFHPSMEGRIRIMP